jgi:hypothetical protein
MKSSHSVSLPLRVLDVPIALLVLVQTASGALLPYNPTRILFANRQDDRKAYVFNPASSTSSQFRFQALDLTIKLSASNLNLATISTSLPFLDDSAPQPFSAAIDTAGNITVYTGNCTAGPQGARQWKLPTADGSATWTSISPTDQIPNGLGPDYLASTALFTTNAAGTDANEKIYIFGGMCPYQNSTADNWVTHADYSGAMLVVSTAPASSKAEFDTSMSVAKAGPVPSAGQSLTPLTPSYSGGQGSEQTQSQSFLLLGGHTSSAFVNMSQVALFSLPQETWTYISVGSAIGETQTNLSRRDDSALEPRSGHTAVLSSDGKKVVVYGGWVGDVDTPATPELIILNVADGYGGKGDWEWTAPPTTGTGPASGSSLYGHGAVMLPGNIMLVTGGYSMVAIGTGQKRTSVTQQLNSQSYLYNMTSNTWIADYTIPDSAWSNLGPPSAPLSTSSSSNATKTGIGIGVGIAGAIIIILVIGCLWYRQRLKRKREQREEEWRGIHRFDSDEWGLSGFNSPDARGFAGQEIFHEKVHGSPKPTGPSYGPMHPAPPGGWRNPSSQQAVRTGVSVNIPSPTRGLRKGISGRGPYPYERTVRVVKDPNAIHPIIEGDEEPDAAKAKGKTGDLGSPQGDSDSDPFVDPLGSNPIDTPKPRPMTQVSVQEVNSRPNSDISWSDFKSRPTSQVTNPELQREVHSWISDWERAAEKLIKSLESAGHGPNSVRGTSPSKSEQTMSSISDFSGFSDQYTSTPKRGTVSSFTRPLSLRSSALRYSITIPFLNSLGYGTANANQSPEATLPPSPTTPSRSPTGRRRAESLGASIKDDDSFDTANTSFSKLQAEGEALLGKYHPYGPNYSRARRTQGSDPDTTPEAGPSRTKSERHASNGSSWVGSVRRAMGISSPKRVRSISLTNGSAADKYARRGDISSAASTSAATGPPGTLTPRRSASDAVFWKGRRGAQDWGEEIPDDTDSDWDIESAVENRVVQLMFTVPRERLRVVNADMDGNSQISFDDRDPFDKDDPIGSKTRGKARVFEDLGHMSD